MTRNVHIAIMRKSWGLTKKILNGEKTIESRWYKNKYPPWDNICSGDTIYFKDSGDLVRLKAQVSRVLHFSDLNSEKIYKLLNRYGKDDGIPEEDLEKYFQMFKDKNYCLLIFLRDVETIKPFNINKSGFGSMTAWITVRKLNQVKI